MFTVLNLVYIVVVLVSVSLATEASGYLFFFLKKQNKTETFAQGKSFLSGEWTLEPCTLREVQIMHNVNIPFAVATLSSNQTLLDEKTKQNKNIKHLN